MSTVIKKNFQSVASWQLSVSDILLSAFCKDASSQSSLVNPVSQLISAKLKELLVIQNKERRYQHLSYW